MKNYKTLLLAGMATMLSLQAVAQAPRVVTDTRFARGATMAFGRIKSAATNGGSTIQKPRF